MSPTTFRDSSTRSTTADVSTPLWAILARNSSSTATPGPRSNPRPDYCPAQGAHSIRGSFFGPVAIYVGIDWCVFGRHEAIRSCGEVNDLIVWFLGEGLPSVDFGLGDLF